MNLIKEIWTNDDIKDFQNYLKSLENKEKIEWTKNSLQTQMTTLAIPIPALRKIANNIYKGNYLSFLDFMLWDYHENASINGILISKIRNFDTLKKYLGIYSEKVDNWASCDILSFNIKGLEKQFLSLAKDYSKSSKPFVRRISIIILFKFLSYEEYDDTIFNLIDSFSDDKEYYVNMANAWLLCECFIKKRKKTINYLDKNNLSEFTINKAIQKCRDSYRVSPEDKEMLLRYKKR